MIYGTSERRVKNRRGALGLLICDWVSPEHILETFLHESHLQGQTEGLAPNSESTVAQKGSRQHAN